ncbi:calcium-binding protein [Hoeflea sp.]|uniref:calcium-binding protein n=1 Tax=Hoeflea sp. TaxID=1940281 RepID=UPI003BB1CB0E
MPTLDVTPTSDQFTLTLLDLQRGDIAVNGVVVDSFNAMDGFITGSGDDTFVWDDFGGAYTIDGGDGTDTFSVADSGFAWDVNLSTGIAGAPDTEVLLQNIENVNGSDEDNLITANGLANTLEGGKGFDTLSYAGSSEAVTLNLHSGSFSGGDAEGDTANGFEAFIGSQQGDYILSFSGDWTCRGGGGNDRFMVASGLVNIYGDAGNDTITLFDDSLADGSVLDGGSEFDTLLTGFAVSSAGSLDLRGLVLNGLELLRIQNDRPSEISIDADQFTANFSAIHAVGQGADVHVRIFMDTATDLDLSGLNRQNYFSEDNYFMVVEGDGDDETIIGSSARDVIKGGDGDDHLHGGLGADEIDGGTGTDFARYDDAASAVAVYLANDRPNSGEAAGDTFTDIEGLYLSAHNDYAFGDDNPNYIYGQGGSDSIAGGLGADHLDGGEGFDYVRYDDAAYPDDIRVYLQAQYSNLNTGVAAIGDTFVSIEGLQGSVGNDTLFGNSEDNILLGNGGTDNLYGFTGNDTLYGGAGDPNGDGVRDNFVFDQAPIAANADIVGDFERGLDQIALSSDIFGTDESRIQLNPNTSELVYTGVSGNEYNVIATLTGETVFDASDYYFY